MKPLRSRRHPIPTGPRVVYGTLAAIGVSDPVIAEVMEAALRLGRSTVPSRDRTAVAVVLRDRPTGHLAVAVIPIADQ